MQRQTLERDFFRTLNHVVEPAVRRGLFSPRYAPGSVIVLETVGFKTRTTRRTPLLATRLGRYVFISTARGERSFWVKNLQKEPRIRYFQGGRVRDAEAFVMMPGKHYQRPRSLPLPITKITDQLASLTERGWAFAVLKTDTRGQDS